MKTFFDVLLICALIFKIHEVSGEREIKGNYKAGLDIKQTIEKFITDLRIRIPEIFIIADQNFTIRNNKYVTGAVNFSSITCTGLKEFNATVIYRKIVPIPEAYTLILDNINLNLNYTSSVVLYNSKFLSVFGAGSANINLTNLIFDGNVSVSFIPINATTNVKIDLDNVSINITGLLNDEPFSKELGKYLALTIKTIFDNNKFLLSDKLSKTLNSVIQKILAHRQYSRQGKNIDLTEEDPLNDFLSLF